MTPQHISVQEVKAACRKAYDAGNLIAQSANHVYAYEGRGGIKCAIGCALTDATLGAIDVHKLQRVTLGEDEHTKRLPFTFDPAEFDELCAIQSAHDVWLANEFQLPLYRKKFLMLIDYPDARIVCMVRDPRAVVASYKGFAAAAHRELGLESAEYRQWAESDRRRIRRSYHPLLASLLWRATIRADDGWMTCGIRRGHGANEARRRHPLRGGLEPGKEIWEEFLRLVVRRNLGVGPGPVRGRPW